MHICVGKLSIIGPDNGLSPNRRQAIIWTNAGILLIGTLGTNFSEISIEICTFSFKKMCLKMSSGKWRPCCLGLNVLTPPAGSWGCYNMEKLSTSLTHCEENTLVTIGPLWGESTGDYGFLLIKGQWWRALIFALLLLNKLLNKQWSCCWFEMIWCLFHVSLMIMGRQVK